MGDGIHASAVVDDTGKIERSEVTFRMRNHVHEYLCPYSPNQSEMGDCSVFVGGGITNCPDWQIEFADILNSEFARLLRSNSLIGEKHLCTLLNPRRINFPIHDPSASDQQIKWEFDYLRLAKAVSMWFPNATEGPISLLETGKWMVSSKPFFLGIEPGYERADALLAHVSAVRPLLKYVNSLQESAQKVALWALGREEDIPPLLSYQIQERSIYLSGGIKGCPNWQAEFSELLVGSTVNVVNPRKEKFSINNTEQYKEAVKANRQKFEQCEAVAVWFPKEKLTPIALLEFGTLIGSSRRLFVGIDPGYSRRVDVEVQTKLARPEIEIAYSLAELSEQVKRQYSEH